MARVADVRRLGDASGGLASSGGVARPKPKVPLSKAGRSYSNSLPEQLRERPSLLSGGGAFNGLEAAAALNASRESSNNTLSQNVHGCTSTSLSHNMNSIHGNISSTRPSSRGRMTAPLQRGGEWGPSISFSAPVGQQQQQQQNQQQQQQQHHASAAGGAGGVAMYFGGGRPPRTLSGGFRGVANEGEDLFAVLERRIAQQRDDLAAHRASIEETIHHDVQLLEVRVKKDEADLHNVYTKYREAMDELARLRALVSHLEAQTEDAHMLRDEARAAAEDAREREKEEGVRQAAAVTSLEEELTHLREQVQGHCQESGRIEALEHALTAAKKDSSTLHHAQAEAASLQARLRSASDAAAAAAAQLQLERHELQQLVNATNHWRIACSQQLHAVEEEAVWAQRELAAAVKEAEEESVRVASKQEAAARRAEAVERYRQEDLSARRRAEEEAEGARAELAKALAELKHRDVAVRLAAEQVEHAESECTRAQEQLQHERQRGLSDATQLSIAAATIDRLEKEVAAQAQQLGGLEQTQASLTLDQLASTPASSAFCTSSTSSTLTTSQKTHESVASSQTTEKQRSHSFSALPEGSEVAKGVGVFVTINSKERETVKSLQTTIKEKEQEVVRITTKLATTTNELRQTKDYWNGTQNECTTLQRRMRAQQTELAQQAAAAAAAAADAARERDKAAAAAAQASEAAVCAGKKMDALELRLELLGKERDDAEERAGQALVHAALLQKQVAEERERALSLRQAGAELEEAFKAREHAWEREKQALADNLAAAHAAMAAHSAQVEEMQRQLEASLSAARQDCRGLQATVAAMQQEVARKETNLTTLHARQMQKLTDEIEERVDKQVCKRQRLLDSKERMFRTTVSKLLSSEESLESSLTCMACVSLIKHPVTLVPCGHSFCEACVQSQSGGGGRHCGECGPSVRISAVVPNEALDALSSKFGARMHQLTELQKALAASSLPEQ